MRPKKTAHLIMAVMDRISITDLLRSLLDHFDKFNEDNIRDLYMMFATISFYRSTDDEMRTDDPSALTKNVEFLMDSSGVNVQNWLFSLMVCFCGPFSDYLWEHLTKLLLIGSMSYLLPHRYT